MLYLLCRVSYENRGECLDFAMGIGSTDQPVTQGEDVYPIPVNSGTPIARDGFPPSGVFSVQEIIYDSLVIWARVRDQCTEEVIKECTRFGCTFYHEQAHTQNEAPLFRYLARMTKGYRKHEIGPGTGQ